MGHYHNPHGATDQPARRAKPSAPRSNDRGSKPPLTVPDRSREVKVHYGRAEFATFWRGRGGPAAARGNPVPRSPFAAGPGRVAAASPRARLIGSRVLGLGSRAQSAADVRPPRAPASAPDTAAAGKDPWIRRAVTGELPEPHAPSALLELSSLDPGLGACLRQMRSRQHRAGLSHRTHAEKRPGWDSAGTGHLVYLV